MRETLALTTGWCKKACRPVQNYQLLNPHTHPTHTPEKPVESPYQWFTHKTPKSSKHIPTLWVFPLRCIILLLVKRLCIRGHYRRYINAVLFYLLSAYTVCVSSTYCHIVWCIRMPADPWKFITVLVPIPYPYRWEFPWEFTYYGSPGILVLDVNFLNTYICQTINRRKNLHINR